MALTTAIITAITTAYTMYQQAQAANYQAAVARNNATIQRNNAILYQQQAEQQAIQQQRKNDLLLAHQRSAYAAGGVDITEGSPLLVMADSAKQAALEEANIRYAGILRGYGAETAARSYENEAGYSTWQASKYRTGAGLSLLGGAVKSYTATRSPESGYQGGNSNLAY